MIKPNHFLSFLLLVLFIHPSCQGLESREATQSTVSQKSMPGPVQSADAGISVEASSSLSSSKDPGRYDASNLLDGDLSTAWVEGANNLGLGEYAEFSFPGNKRIEGVVLFPGYQKSTATFIENAVPSTIEIRIDGKTQGSYDLRYRWEYRDLAGHSNFRHNSDPMNRQPRLIIFDEPVKADQARLIIRQGYEGTQYPDLCISEVEWLFEGQPSRFLQGSARQALINIRDHRYDSLHIAQEIQILDLSRAEQTIVVGHNSDTLDYNRHEPGPDFEERKQMLKMIRSKRSSPKDLYNRFFRYTHIGLINKPVVVVSRDQKEDLIGSRAYQSEGVSEWVDGYPLLVFEKGRLIRTWEIADLDGAPAPDQGYIPPLQ